MWYQNPSRFNTLPRPFAANAGVRMKIAVKSVSDTPMVQPIALLEICSSSGICRFADHASALNPSAIDSASAITPRTNGIFDQRCAHSGASCTSMSIAPSGMRTATAQLCSPRIITPSMTAWPPM